MLFIWCLVLLYADSVTSSDAYTNIWAVKLHGDLHDAKELADKHGFVLHKHLLEDYYTFIKPELKQRSEKTVISTDIDRNLTLEAKIEWFQQQKEKKYQLLSISFNDKQYHEQWYFNRKYGATYDITSVWEQGYTGLGIVVAVVDDGVNGKHPELSKNYISSASYDFLDNDPIPEPSGKTVSGHGNNCAGVIAGVANNTLCGVGIAYNAKIAGIRLFDENIKSTDATESQALVYKLDEVDIYSNSWGPGDMGWQVEGPGTLTSAALKRGVEKGRNGLGAIYTFAAGNGGITQDSCAYNGYVNSIYTIAINGVNEDGSNPTYAEECPSIMATAYSRDTLRRIGKVITIDGQNGCSETFGASSASSAMASGLIALALEANPNLTWRDMQHIIVRSSRSAPGGKELQRGGWKTNKANFKVSKFYGFGLMDAEQMVQEAKNWKRVPSQLGCEIKGSDFNRSIPSTVNVSVSIANCGIRYLEHVQVKINLHFGRRGDLGLELQAPSGTTSPLTRQRKYDNFSGYKNLTNWIITTLFNWGENPVGEWRLKVTNLDQRRYRHTRGTLYSWSLILYGTSLHPTNSRWRPSKPLSPTGRPSIKVDGKYSPWSYWTRCTKTCGGGTRRRFRACTSPRPLNGGKDCKTLPGQSMESQRCNIHECKIDGGYSSWSKWSECSEKCGGGFQYRDRTCDSPVPQNGGACNGENHETKACNTNACSEISKRFDGWPLCNKNPPKSLCNPSNWIWKCKVAVQYFGIVFTYCRIDPTYKSLKCPANIKYDTIVCCNPLCPSG